MKFYFSVPFSCASLLYRAICAIHIRNAIEPAEIKNMFGRLVSVSITFKKNHSDMSPRKFQKLVKFIGSLFLSESKIKKY